MFLFHPHTKSNRSQGNIFIDSYFLVMGRKCDVIFGWGLGGKTPPLRDIALILGGGWAGRPRPYGMF